MLALLVSVASECGPPRCTEPLTTGATFDAEYMQLDASAGCQHARSSADGTTEPRSPDNDSCLRV